MAAAIILFEFDISKSVHKFSPSQFWLSLIDIQTYKWKKRYFLGSLFTFPTIHTKLNFLVVNLGIIKNSEVRIKSNTISCCNKIYIGLVIKTSGYF